MASTNTKTNKNTEENHLYSTPIKALEAAWDGKSKGTKHMIDIAKSKGLEVRVVRY